MSSLSLREAYARALQDAPGISKEAFLEQTRLHLLAGRLKASAYSCELVGEEETPWGAPYYFKFSPAALDHKRRDIPAVEWAELDFWLEDESAVIWGHERSPQWTQETGRWDACWSECNLENAPIYTEIRLTSESGDFSSLWRAHDAPEGDVDEQKEKLTWAAIDKHGIEILRGMKQKDREALVIKTVAEENPRLKPSDRYVRDFISGARRRPA
jgi:hypothetical protein